MLELLSYSIKIQHLSLSNFAFSKDLFNTKNNSNFFKMSVKFKINE